MQVRCALDGGQDKRFLANQTKTGHFDSKLSKITDLRSDKRKIRENSRKKKKKENTYHSYGIIWNIYFVHILGSSLLLMN